MVNNTPLMGLERGGTNRATQQAMLSDPSMTGTPGYIKKDTITNHGGKNLSVARGTGQLGDPQKKKDN